MTAPIATSNRPSSSIETVSSSRGRAASRSVPTSSRRGLRLRALRHGLDLAGRADRLRRRRRRRVRLLARTLRRQWPSRVALAPGRGPRRAGRHLRPHAHAPRHHRPGDHGLLRAELQPAGHLDDQRRGLCRAVRRLGPRCLRRHDRPVRGPQRHGLRLSEREPRERPRGQRLLRQGRLEGGHGRLDGLRPEQGHVRGVLKRRGPARPRRRRRTTQPMWVKGRRSLLCGQRASGARAAGRCARLWDHGAGPSLGGGLTLLPSRPDGGGRRRLAGRFGAMRLREPQQRRRRAPRLAVEPPGARQLREQVPPVPGKAACATPPRLSAARLPAAGAGSRAAHRPHTTPVTRSG